VVIFIVVVVLLRVVLLTEVELVVLVEVGSVPVFVITLNIALV
jgi:hypothetical protein